MKIRGPKVIVHPESEPISIAEARAHVEFANYGDTTQDDADDDMLAGLLAASREHCEQFLGLTLTRKILEIELDAFPNDTDDGTDEIEIPFGPVVTVMAVDPTGSSSSSSEAVVTPILDDYSTPNRLRPPVGGWPAGGPIRIRYAAGYGVDSDDVGEPLPSAIRSAILLVFGHLYANREETTEKAMQSLPLGVEALLRPLRVRLGLA